MNRLRSGKKGKERGWVNLRFHLLVRKEKFGGGDGSGTRGGHMGRALKTSYEESQGEQGLLTETEGRGDGKDKCRTRVWGTDTRVS